MSVHQLTVSNIRQPHWSLTLFDSPATIVPVVWLALRVWLGWQWIEAGLHKLSSPAWMTTGTALQSYWTRAVTIPPAPASPPITYDWYRSFLQFLLATGSYTWFAKLITYGEILVGIGLILGAVVGVAALFGALMNLNFMLAGSASSNPLMFLAAIFLILAWKVAGYYGLDRWILPAIGTPWTSGWLLSDVIHLPQSASEKEKAA